MEISDYYTTLIFPSSPDIVSLYSDIIHFITPHKDSISFIQNAPSDINITEDLYYQLYIMKYSLSCSERFYMTWNSNLLPSHKISMLNRESGMSYMDLCDYDDTRYLRAISALIPGLKKTIPQSFATDHMLFRTDIMQNLISDIENNTSIPGRDFSEKIVNCCVEGSPSFSFNACLLYGIYTSIKYPSVYKLRKWNVLQYGSELLPMEKIDKKDLVWLSKDFDAITFDNNRIFIPEYAEIFKNEYYREKLSPMQVINAIYDHSESEDDNNSIEGFSPDDRLKYLDSDTYKTYEKLGDDFSTVNLDQSYLCYENAAFLCNDPDSFKRIISKKENLTKSGNVNVNKTAIIIISYNNKAFTKSCLESIYTNCNPDSCTVMIFDNGSTDGSQEWLSSWGKSHDEAVVILNDTNLGFGGGNNACCCYLPDGYDVFYLNNDTRIPANALFWMRMALYSSEDIGGVGAVQNYAKGDQLEDVYFDLPEQYVEYGAKHNIYEPDPYEEQSKICGFAMLISREMYDKTGGFDEQFNPGFLEDDDLSLQIRSAGKKLILCQNAFIYHAGSQSFRKRDDINELFKINREKCTLKWGFDPTLFAAMSENEYAFILSLKRKGYTKDSRFSLVHIGCGCGNMLGHIHYLYPNAMLSGVEKNDIARKYAISCIPVFPTIGDLPMALNEYNIVVKDLG